MQSRGIRLEYGFSAQAQHGDEIVNPLFELLAALHEAGSIHGATQRLGQSYRHVWGNLKRWEEALGEPLVQWSQGRRARLSAFGQRLLWAEARARSRLGPHIDALRAELQRVLTEAIDGSREGLAIVASHDLALPRLRELADRHHGLHIELRFAGSVDALQALAAGRCTVAGFHVPQLPEGSPVFARALKPLLKPGRHKLIGCLRRTQGLMWRDDGGPPPTLQSLAQPPAGMPRRRFVNRQAGSGTRLLMEHLMDAGGLGADRIPGWSESGEPTHAAVAATIAAGEAEVGPGIAAAAALHGLRFAPLIDEDYYLVCLKESLDSPAVGRLRAALADPGWAQALATLPQYAPQQSGQVVALTRALPWWHYRVPREQRAAAAALRQSSPGSRPTPGSTR